MDFFTHGVGLAIFIIVDVAVLVLIMALNYKWLFKRVLDILFSFVFLAVFLVFFLIFLLIDAIYNRVTNAYPSLFETNYYSGKKGKVISVTTFTTERNRRDEEGNLLPREEQVTGLGRAFEACGMKYYPALCDIFAGRISFVGPRLMNLTDAAALSDEGAARYNVRPGLVSSLERYGGETLTYPDMFEEDAVYAESPNMFRDIVLFFTKIAHRVRGDEEKEIWGECAGCGYVEWLRKNGEITERDAERYEELGKERLAGYRRKSRERKNFENRLLQ